MAVIIPQDFEENLKHKQPTSITVIVNGTNTMTSGLASSLYGANHFSIQSDLVRC